METEAITAICDEARRQLAVASDMLKQYATDQFPGSFTPPLRIARLRIGVVRELVEALWVAAGEKER